MEEIDFLQVLYSLKDDLDNWLNSFHRLEHLGQDSCGVEHA